MKQTIYLVGQISPKFEETYQWRRNVKENLFQYKNILEIIDPCSNQFNEKVLEKKRYAVTKEKRSFGIDVLVPKDYTFCKRSDIAIVNMNQYDSNKPLIGSFFELAWYYTMPEKAVIGFADDLNSYACQHPFVKKAVSAWCKNEEEACYLIEKYFINLD
jgi:nucleoside 2-deoxyribosyltransferase